MPCTVGQELESIVSMLTPRYPDLSKDDIHVIVDTAYRDLVSSARLRAHLMPLTENRCQRLLAARAEGGELTKRAS
jgi:hypothetical protein